MTEGTPSSRSQRSRSRSTSRSTRPAKGPAKSSASRKGSDAVEEIPDSERGRVRVLIESVSPEVDAGLHPIRRVVGEKIRIDAIIISDGHDAVSARLRYRHVDDADWSESHLLPTHNDHWLGEIRCERQGTYLYTVEAWVDRFKTWRRDLRAKFDAGQDIAVDLLGGASLLRAASERASKAPGSGSRQAAETILRAAEALADENGDTAARVKTALDEELWTLVDRYPDRSTAERYRHELRAYVERQRARFSAWYEMFPRSASAQPGRHGTFKDCEARLPYVADLGFDVLYLPPIHPIGRVKRKGPNNALTAGPEDPGSPWAIGAREGGHMAVHPELGTLDDFRQLVSKARDVGIDVAMDIAFQCAPDHPYVQEHPEWFRRRPDGSIQYAENPPKKYEDIYPFDFETTEWKALWTELRRIFLFWIDQGVRVFRVDNPHTKSFRFWAWCIRTIKERHPDVIFLAEAFTRPNIKYHLAKIGFTQSYTYFAWRTRKAEIQEYVTELTRTNVAEFCIPNFWPNTPDILTDQLQHGGRATFVGRAVLAATLTSSYGLYGPAFELLEHVPRNPGSEEYLNSEKYQLRHWNLDDPKSIAPVLRRLNRIRRDNPALQANETVHFHPTDNPEIICYSKTDEDSENRILVLVNLDPKWKHAGWTALDLDRLGLAAHETFRVRDLLSDRSYEWRGPRNFVELDPLKMPAHVFRIERITQTAGDRAGERPVK